MTAPATVTGARPHAHEAHGGVAVAAEGLTRRFGRTTVITDVHLAVQAGEVHALIGANGAGKTTLLRMLSGASTPTAGRVRICGVAPHDRRARARIGLLTSSDRGFYLRLSAKENLRFFGRLQGMSAAALRQRIPEVLDQVGLAGAGRRRTGLYSRGMLRRLAVARALLTGPDVLLLDEATHDLDPEGAQLVRDLVSASGAATVWATQRLGELDGFADTVTILAGGRQRFRGPIAELVTDVDVRFVVSVVGEDGRRPELRRIRTALGGIGQVEPPPGRARGRGGAGDAPHGVVLVLPRQTGLGRAVVALHEAGLDVRSAMPERPDVEQALLRVVRDSSG